MTGGEIQGLDTLETPERVDIEIDLAGVGSRSLAFLLDAFLLVAIFVATGITMLVSGYLFRSLAVVLWLLANFLLQWFYFAFFEAAWTGQTPGKRLVGLRVQKVGGYPVGWSEALIRNFLRPLVDMFLMWMPIGLLVMLFTARHQRIGDLAAGTVVVRERAIRLQDLADLGYRGNREAAPAATAGPELTVQEFELLHDFLARRHDLDEASRRRIGASLAGVLRDRLVSRGRLPEELRSLDDETFLGRVDEGFRGGWTFDAS